MKTHLWTILLLLLAPVLVTGCMGSDDDPTANDLQVGDTLPSFAVDLTVSDSGDWRFSDAPLQVTTQSFKGGKAVIVFFNTECPDCQEELPVIQNFYDEIKGDPSISLVCISRAETEESIKEYWNAHNLTLPYSPQADKTVFNLFAEYTIPRIYITDTANAITRIFTDNPKATLEQLEEGVKNEELNAPA